MNFVCALSARATLPNYHQWGKLKALSRPGAPQRHLAEFLDNGDSTLYFPPKGRARSLDSGVNNYICFCDLTEPTPPPPSAGDIRRWITSFSPGGAFGLYINRVRKAAILLDRDDPGLAPEIRLVDEGDRNAHGGRFAHPNYIMAPDAMRLVVDLGWEETWECLLTSQAYYPPASHQKPYNLRLPTLTENC